jgi:hypothetical protein
MTNYKEDKTYQNWLGGRMDDLVDIYEEDGEEGVIEAMKGMEYDDEAINEAIGYIIQNS